MTVFLAAILLLSGASLSLAQPLVEEMPGYVDLARFGSFDLDDAKVEINLGGALLHLLSSAVEEEDDEFSKLLSSLKLIRSDDRLILGLLATWADENGNLGLLNIVGDFDPAQIARLARQLDIGALQNVDLGALEDPDR